MKTWLQLTNCAFSSYASNRIDTISYFIGKLIRFGFFWLMIVSLFRYTETLVGYDKYEVLLFFIIYNIVDVVSQAFFRGLYIFKNDVLLGNFDFALTKPINPLFYTLTKLTDLLDLILTLPLVGALIYIMYHISVSITPTVILVFILFLIFSFTLITSLHILSAAVTMWTTESEGVIWVYRYMMLLGTFPPEMYNPLLQTVLTYILPIIIIVAFPTKVLLGLFTPQMLLIAVSISILLLFISTAFWKLSIRRYSSASS